LPIQIQFAEFFFERMVKRAPLFFVHSNVRLGVHGWLP
jgi:hypothetical protein